MSTTIGKIDVSNFDGDGLEIIGMDEADLLFGTENDDLLVAGDGNDVITAERGDDSVVGGLGDDCIHGDLGDDLIIGGEGVDTLDSGAGSDTIYGGAGEDVFEFNIEDFSAGEVDTIGDFNFGQDKIVINGFSDGDEISFDPTTNSISLNGKSIISLGLADNIPELNIEDNDDGDCEII